MGDGIERFAESATKGMMVFGGIASIVGGISALSTDHYFSYSNILGYALVAGGIGLVVQSVRLGYSGENSNQVSQQTPQQPRR